MTTASDPLLTPQPAERCVYHTGVLLDQDDFTAEQTYHRGRLARLAGYLGAPGTLAGLEVAYEAAVLPSGLDPGHEERLVVRPGVAIDRLGRLIELQDPACLRLGSWFSGLTATPDGRALLDHALKPAVAPRPAGVVVDVFLAFAVCEHGKQPAFETGAYDALDAVVASRLRDAFALTLVARLEDLPPLPDPVFPDIADPAARRSALIDAKFATGWHEGSAWRADGKRLNLLPEHTTSQDGSELFLARIVVPAVAGTPVARTADPVWLDNRSRRFAFNTAELAWLAANVR